MDMHSYNGKQPISNSELKQKFDSFSPLFRNLFENKVICHDRFTSIIKLTDLKLYKDRFEAKANRLYLISEAKINRNYPESWNIGANWAYLKFDNNALFSYVGWIIWTDPQFVKSIEDLVLADQNERALDLTIRTI